MELSLRVAKIFPRLYEEYFAYRDVDLTKTDGTIVPTLHRVLAVIYCARYAAAGKLLEEFDRTMWQETSSVERIVQRCTELFLMPRSSDLNIFLDTATDAACTVAAAAFRRRLDLGSYRSITTVERKHVLEMEVFLVVQRLLISNCLGYLQSLGVGAPNVVVEFVSVGLTRLHVRSVRALARLEKFIADAELAPLQALHQAFGQKLKETLDRWQQEALPRITKRILEKDNWDEYKEELTDDELSEEPAERKTELRDLISRVFAAEEKLPDSIDFVDVDILSNF